MATQTHDPALHSVRNTLVRVGYDDRAIIYDYDFAAPGSSHGRDQVDLAAFSDPIQHDLRTSCVAVTRITPNDEVHLLLDNLSHLAVPIALTLTPDGADIWSVRGAEHSRLIESVSHDGLPHYITEHARDFRPANLHAAKTNGQQLTFFDLDRSLLEFALDSTQTLLVERFETVVRVATDALNLPDGQSDNLPAKAALQVLAAAILDDKGLLGSTSPTTATALLGHAAKRYSKYFDQNTALSLSGDILQEMLRGLRYNITFRSYTNEMLGYFYENAFVDQDVRRQLGVYYTPQILARRILSRLPVEELRPSNRVVFDGSSGSGNLLLAGYERLEALLPRDWDKQRKHDYLVRRIRGEDVDPFAAQVAALSLFLLDLPAGDPWDVSGADFLTSRPADLRPAPTILVGNPPFREERSSDGKRLQKASLFVSRYLDLLTADSMLGLVLPETFLENSSCANVRRRLLEECDLLELWHLPEGIFPMSSVATIVVLARKQRLTAPRQANPVRVERVSARPESISSFLTGGRPKFLYIVPSTDEWR